MTPGDEIDIENLALRMPGDMDRRGVAEVLGIQDKSVWRLVTLGKLERPHHYEDVETNNHGSVRQGVWTAQQVARMIFTYRSRGNAEKCVNGHEWTEENTMRRANGHRRCRKCQQAHQRLYQATRRARKAS